MLEENERKILRRITTSAAERAIGLRARARPAIDKDSALWRPAPVFVTWMRDGRPRGRSGTVAPDDSLVGLVEKFAVKALLHDPRVPPATAKEFPRYEPEISVLSPFEEFSGAEGLLEGIHGVMVEKGKRCGIVLPGDGKDLGWEGARLLSQACLRAGLPEESWKAASGPRLLRFTAEVF